MEISAVGVEHLRAFLVYVQFRDRAGNKTEPVKATTTLRPGIGGGFGLGSGEISMPTTRLTRESSSSGPEETSRLASDEVDSLPSDDPEIFFDAYDTEAHGKSLRWRELNSRGYVISRRSATDAILHRAYRSHFEHGDKSTNLTRTMKVSSQNREDLEAWAREHVGAGSRGVQAACNALGVCGGDGAAKWWLRMARVRVPSVTLSRRLVRTGLACTAEAAKSLRALARTERA